MKTRSRRWARCLGGGAAAVLLGGGLALVGAAPATAAEFTASCSSPIDGSPTLTVNLDVPREAAPGQEFTPTGTLRVDFPSDVAAAARAHPLFGSDFYTRAELSGKLHLVVVNGDARQSVEVPLTRVPASSFTKTELVFNFSFSLNKVKAPNSGKRAQFEVGDRFTGRLVRAHSSGLTSNWDVDCSAATKPVIATTSVPGATTTPSPSPNNPGDGGSGGDGGTGGDSGSGDGGTGTGGTEGTGGTGGSGEGGSGGTGGGGSTTPGSGGGTGIGGGGSVTLPGGSGGSRPTTPGGSNFGSNDAAGPDVNPLPPAVLAPNDTAPSAGSDLPGTPEEGDSPEDASAASGDLAHVDLPPQTQEGGVPAPAWIVIILASLAGGVVLFLARFRMKARIARMD